MGSFFGALWLSAVDLPSGSLERLQPSEHLLIWTWHIHIQGSQLESEGHPWILVYLYPLHSSCMAHPSADLSSNLWLYMIAILLFKTLGPCNFTMHGGLIFCSFFLVKEYSLTYPWVYSRDSWYLLKYCCLWKVVYMVSRRWHCWTNKADRLLHISRDGVVYGLPK